METYVEIAVAAMSTIVAFAVSWGVFTTKLNDLHKEVDAMRDIIKAMPTRESCDLKHKYTDNDIREIKEFMREVRQSLKDIEQHIMGRSK